MKIIGITGGVGAGKSTVLKLIKSLCKCDIVMADDVAKSLMQYGEELSNHAIRIFGKESYTQNGQLNTAYISKIMYSNENLKKEWVDIVHPAVKNEILEQITKCNKDYFFVEAALLIEEHYDEICDEIWYIYAPEDERIKRIMENRGYSLLKAQSIIANQLSHEEFLAKSDFVIDNGISIEKTRLQIENKLEEL